MGILKKLMLSTPRDIEVNVKIIVAARSKEEAIETLLELLTDVLKNTDVLSVCVEDICVDIE